jgi:hypothetical protein
MNTIKTKPDKFEKTNLKTEKRIFSPIMYKQNSLAINNDEYFKSIQKMKHN